MLAGDNRAAWDPDVLNDPRVTLLRHARQLVGGSLQAHDRAFRDTFLVNGPDPRWRDEPERALASDSPIIAATDETERTLLPIVGNRLECS